MGNQWKMKMWDGKTIPMETEEMIFKTTDILHRVTIWGSARHLIVMRIVSKAQVP